MPMVLRLLGGSVDVAGPSGRRTIAADDLFVGPLESSLHHDEIAISAFFPALADGAGVAFEEIARRHGDYALCGVAALVTDDAVHAGYLSVCDVPTVVDLTGVADGDLGDAALEHLDPGDDIHASAAYRAQLVRVLTARVVGGRQEDGPDEGGTVSEELHEVRLQVNGVAHDVAVPARRLLSDALRHDVGPDRHPRRLRARRLRRVHGAGRRPADAVVPDVRGLRRRLRDHHGRGADRGRRLAGPGAAGVPRVPRPAVRLLHARVS